MAAPLVISFWMRAAFTLVDTVYAAWAIGDTGVAAIGLTFPFEYLMIALWVGLSTGLTSCLSRAMGARQGEKIAQYVRATWICVWTVSPLFLLIGAAIWLIAPRIGSLEPDLARQFAIYGATLIGGSAFTTFWSVIPDSIVKAHHDTRSTMWAGIWSNVINVVLNTIFTFVFHWGIFGIAFSTVIGRIGGLAYALVRARKHEERRRREWGEWSPARDPAPYRALFALAIPSSVTFVLMGAETGIVNRLLAGLEHPVEAIAAYSIFQRVALFMFNPIIAAAVALLPYMARRYGEGDFAGMRRGFREAGLAAAAYCILITGPIMILGARMIARPLAESDITWDYATFALRLVPFALLAGTPFLLCRPVFEGMSRGRPGLLMAVLRFGILTLPLAWCGIVVAQRLGQPGLYGMMFGLFATALISSTIFLTWTRRQLAAGG